MPLPDFEAWAVFSRVAEIGSISRAAAELGVSKSTVSKALARLEARIGARLFNRTSRRLALTEAGRAARAGAARILAEAEALEAETDATSRTPRGPVRLAAPMSFGLLHVAPRLPDLLSRFPQISLDLHLSDAQVDLVGGGFDLGLRIAALADSSLRARRLCAIGRSLVASPAYLERHGRPRHPSELEAHRCLGYANLPTPNRWRFVSRNGAEVAVTPAGPLCVNNAEALSPALLAGLGLAVQPDFIVWEDLASGRLERVLAEWSLTAIALHLVVPPGEPRPARVAAVAEFLVEAFSGAPWSRPERATAHPQTV